MSLPDGVGIEIIHESSEAWHKVSCSVCGWVSQQRYSSEKTALRWAEKHAGSARCRRRQRRAPA